MNDTTGWTLNGFNGDAANEQQIRDVLGDVQGVEVRGEYRSGSDTGDLDNFAMVTAPNPQVVPAPWALTGGLLLLPLAALWQGRRQRA